MASRKLGNRDVIPSERETVEEELREKEKKLRTSLFESISDGIIVIDLGGKILDMNKAGLRLQGHSDKREVIGLNGFEGIAEKDRSRAAEDAMKAIELGYGPLCEYTFVDKNGREYEAENSASVLHDSAGNAAGLIGIFRDITDRKRMEQSLRESEGKIRNVFESITDGIFAIDLNGNYTEVNDSLCYMHGLKSKDDLLKKNAFEFVAQRDLERAAIDFQRTLEKEKVVQLEYVALRADGSEFPAEVNAVVVKDVSGNAVGIIGSLRDITERKRAEEELRDSEERYRLLAENVTDVIWTMDMNLQYTYVSPSVIQQRGYSVEEVMTQGLEENLTPASIETATKVFTEGLAADKMEPKDLHRLWTVELEVYCKDGSTIWTEQKTTFLRDADGQPVGILGVSRDISEHKRADEAVRESEGHYRLLAENVTDVIWTVDMDLRFTYASPSVERMRGYSVEEAMAQSLVDNLCPNSLEVALQVYEEELALEEMEQKDLFRTRTLELEQKCKDGSTIWTEVTMTFLRNADGQAIGILGVSRDISERKRAEEELQESESKFTILTEQSPNMIFINKKGRVVYVNQKCEELMGYEKEEFYSPDFDFLSLIAPEFRNIIGENFRRHLSGENVSPYEFSLLTKDGRTIDGILMSGLVPYEGEIAIVGIVTDITERKLAEKTLRESEEKYRDLAENINDIIYTVDQNGVITYISPIIESVLGYSPDELLGQSFAEKIHQEDMQSAAEGFLNTLSGNSTIGEFRLLSKSGEARWIHTSNRPLFEGDSVIGATGVLSDITERKLADDVLRESEERQRILFQSISDGILVTDLEGRLIDGNGAAANLLGYSDKAELIGLPGFDFIAEKDRTRAMEDAMKAIELGYGPPCEYTFVDKNGREYDAEAGASLLFDGAGNAMGFITIFRDITERRRAEEELRQSEEKYRKLFEGASDGIFTMELTGEGAIFTNCNSKALTMFGCNLDEIIGKSPLDFSPLVQPDGRPSDEKVKELAVAVMTGEYKFFEWIHTRLDGTTFEVEVALNRVDVGGSSYLQAVVRDITERKLAEAALRESEERYRLLAENVTDVIWTTDMNIQLTYVSPSITYQRGYSVEEAMTRGIEKDLTPASLEIAMKTFSEALAAEKMESKDLSRTWTLECELYCKDGSTIWAEQEITFLRDADGQPVGILGVSRDITERKLAEDVLRGSEEKQRILFESISDGILVSDLEGQIIDANEAAIRLLGYSDKVEIIGRTGFDFIAEKDCARATEDTMKAIELGHGPAYEYTFVDKNGREYDAEASASLLLDGSGNPVGFVIVVRDITERKHVEDVLRESEVRYRLLADNVTDIIWTMDMNQQFTYFSPSITQLGYSIEEALALSLDRIVTPDSFKIVAEVIVEEMAIEELDVKRKEGAISSQDMLDLLTPNQREAIRDITLDEWLTQRKTQWSKYRMRILEIELYCKDGSTVWAEMAASFMRDSDGKPVGIVGIARDISERKKVEEEKWRAVTEKAAVLDSMGEGLLIIGMEGKVISCNPAFESLSGYTADDLAGKDAFDLINVLIKVEDQQRLLAGFTAALKTRVTGTEYFTLISKDGREIPVATTETVTVDEKGNTTAIIAMFKDITGIRQAETALRDSEEKLRCFMNSATDQFTIWDSDLNLVDLNEAAMKYPLIRHSDKVNKENFIGKNIVELEPHVKERGRYDQYLAVIETGESLLIEDVISNPKLGDIHLSVRAFKVGNGLGMITTDVTESEKAERALRESEQRYRLLADNVTDVISITDLNLQLIYISPSIERLLGYSVKEAMAVTMEHFLTPASLDVAMEALAEEIATRNQKQKGLFWTRTLEMEMTCKDGSTVWTENIVSPLHDQNSKVIGIVGVSRDIRERKQTEIALRESEEKLRRFMDSATDFFTVWDSELNLIDLNIASLNYPVIRNPNGAAKEDYIGRNILDLDPDIKERGRYDQYLEVIRTGEPLFVEDVVHRPKIGDVYLSVRAFKVGDGLGLLSMDITERKRTDETLRQAEKLRALGEMAGGVAHDFNNILSVVLGRAQLALADVKDEKARRSIEIIEQTALDAATMVRRLREVAVVKGERSFDEIDLNKLIEDAIQMVESRRLELEETVGVTIEIHAERNEVAPAAGDAAEMREALVNLLFNAMDAMPEGGNITMASRQEDSSVVLSVSDTGTGIPEEVRRKVFDPFFSTKASKGSGLGLSVTMGIITKHGGSIDVESSEGKGTTFYIRLPIANCVTEKSCPTNKPLLVKRARILLVDDDPEVSDIIGLTLEHLGHSVTVVTSGREALSAFEGDNYGLVITDLGMPDVSGIDVARAVKATKPNTPVMLITGWGVQLDPEQMREIDSVIEKPFGKDALLARMAELLPVKNGVKAQHR